MLAPVMLSASLLGQGVFSNKTQTIVEKVIQDYPNHFYNIRGELISKALQTAHYRSTLEIPGAASSTVTLVSAPGTEGYGWNCTVLQTASFEEARARLSEIYDQLSNSIVSAAGQRTFILSGQYEAPDPAKKENDVILSLLPGVGDLKRLRVELILRGDGQNWTLAISVNDGDPREQAQLAANDR
jgi:hypothetical protein